MTNMSTNKENIREHLTLLLNRAMEIRSPEEFIELVNEEFSREFVSGDKIPGYLNNLHQTREKQLENLRRVIEKPRNRIPGNSQPSTEDEEEDEQ